MSRINIAIDGPSGAGKSTVSNELAKRLGYIFINTGSFYRAVAFYLLNLNIDLNNQELVKQHLHDLANKHSITIDNKEHIYLNGQNITNEIRADQISKASSKIATYPFIREYVVNVIQSITKTSKGYIMDGRDTTFRIMPFAEVKIFLTASSEERTKRRIKQNEELGYITDYNTVLSEIKARDFQDTHRLVDPLHKVEDAIEIDCTNMTFEEVVQSIIRIVNQKVLNG
ncbi:(d)CMP kinase [Mycoplasmopsis meleagridis]|uniref:(d)CMP kinase n=1 Tax=Mycoplasmopsis meleagridis TaxID=29561 RepID=UPI00073D4403|nr:(d)CMP kinase [Mycoplasmopsis meleagridis]KUH47649.1 cytidylate kinase [Mycoplasmopsis meleagridis]